MDFCKFIQVFAWGRILVDDFIDFDRPYLWFYFWLETHLLYLGRRGTLWPLRSQVLVLLCWLDRPCFVQILFNKELTCFGKLTLLLERAIGTTARRTSQHDVHVDLDVGRGAFLLFCLLAKKDNIRLLRLSLSHAGISPTRPQFFIWHNLHHFEPFLPRFLDSILCFLPQIIRRLYIWLRLVTPGAQSRWDKHVEAAGYLLEIRSRIWPGDHLSRPVWKYVRDEIRRWLCPRFRHYFQSWRLSRNVICLDHFLGKMLCCCTFGSDLPGRQHLSRWQVLSDNLIPQLVLQSSLHIVTLLISQLHIMLRTAETPPRQCLLRGQAPRMLRCCCCRLDILDGVLAPVSSQLRCTYGSFAECTFLLELLDISLVLPLLISGGEGLVRDRSGQDWWRLAGVLRSLSKLNHGFKHHLWHLACLFRVWEHAEATLNLNRLSFFNFQVRFLPHLSDLHRSRPSVNWVFLLRQEILSALLELNLRFADKFGGRADRCRSLWP